ncbi:hypothetical protein BDF22DRAFT_742387 [Syncephalis plumigaleata]|nr:hypothetical protein BDF22DRAFT_742387 [Syncephalis plumigaleata]
MTPLSSSSLSSSLATCPPFLSAKLWLSLGRDQRIKACQCWQRHCQSLLNAPADLFWTVVLDTPAIIRFLRTFISSSRFVLAEQEKEECDDSESNAMIHHALLRVGHQVLLILSRLTEPTEAADQQCAPLTAMDYLMQIGLFDAPGIFDMAATYGFSNTSMVLDLLNGVILLAPTFVDQFEQLLEEIMQIFKYPNITLTFSQLSLNEDEGDGKQSSKNKGKGNADLLWPDPSLSSSSSSTFIDYQEVDWPILLDLITALDAFTNVMATGCFPLQIRLYSRWHTWLLIIDRLYLRIKQISPETRRCKYALLIIAYKLLEYRYFATLSIKEDDGSTTVTTPSYEGEICLHKGEQMASAATHCCDILLGLLSTVDEATNDCTLEEYEFLETAPLLVDLEIEFKLSDRITGMLPNFKQSHEDRIEYILLSLKHFKETFPNAKSLREQFTRLATERQRQKSIINYNNNSNGGSRAYHSYPIASSAITAVTAAASSSTTPSTATTTTIVSARDKLSAAIDQIDAIFPGLGHGFIVACLKWYQGDVEKAITHLLEEDLPSELKNMDRQTPRVLSTIEEEDDEIACIYGSVNTNGGAEYEEHLEVADTSYDDEQPSSENLLSTRRNIYDNDEFDLFTHTALDHKRVYQGKRDMNSELKDDAALTQAYKSRIIERVMASDEDEYDDTYDGIYTNGEDVTTTGETITSGDGQSTSSTTFKQSSSALATDPTLVHEPVLIQQYISNPSLFDRSAASRKSAERTQLRDATGLSNEQIEGWASQLARDSKRHQNLVNDTAWRGEQTSIASTTPVVSQSSETASTPSQAPSQTRRNYAFKDRHKAQRANHNRKRGYARKMRDTLPQ